MFLKSSGVTLFEVLFVLAIAASLITLSLQQYQKWDVERNLSAIDRTVDVLFQAAANYYTAHCASSSGPLGYRTVSAPVALSIDTLMEEGFLPANFTFTNPLVDSVAPYVVQLNPAVTKRTELVCQTSSSCAPVNIGTIVLWRIQVAVLMKEAVDILPEQLTAYRNYFQADCLSNIAGTVVSPCSANDPGQYLVFERLPAYASSHGEETQSTFWPSNPLIKQFGQMYTTFPMTYLLGTSHVPEYQYFYCNN